MASVNKVIIIGNLGRDPEVRYTANGSAVCNISVATSRRWKDKTSGEMQEETEWHRVSLFDKTAETAGEYLRKGSSVYIEGRLKTRKYEKDGVDTYVTEIMAFEMTMLGGRESGGDEPAARPAPQRSQQTHGQQRQARAAEYREDPPARSAPTQRSAPPARGGGRQAPKSNTGFDDMDDDIPF